MAMAESPKVDGHYLRGSQSSRNENDISPRGLQALPIFNSKRNEKDSLSAISSQKLLHGVSEKFNPFLTLPNTRQTLSDLTKATSTLQPPTLQPFKK